eukprot:2859643-Pyramimonas_sp.AAC.1
MQSIKEPTGSGTVADSWTSNKAKGIECLPAKLLLVVTSGSHSRRATSCASGIALAADNVSACDVLCEILLAFSELPVNMCILPPSCCTSS